MQMTRNKEIRRLGVRLHCKACAPLGLEAEHATPKHFRTEVPRTPLACLGDEIRQDVRWTPRVPPKRGGVRKHGGTPSGRDKYVMPAAISPLCAARGRSVWGHLSGLVGCKPPLLFMRRASSCPSQQRGQREPWGASPRPSAPAYPPSYLPHRGGSGCRCKLSGENCHHSAFL